MKKSIYIAICSTVLLTSSLYAAKIPTEFGPGVEGFLKTKAPAANYTNLNGWVIFTGLDAKSQIQLTTADLDANILINDAKLIKQKGKIAGSLANILVGSSASDMADPTDVVYGGNKKFSVKLKGVNVGTVIAQTMKLVLIKDLSGKLAGANLKGIKIMTQDGGIEGTVANYVKIGLPEVPTVVKIIKAKKGCINYLDLMDARPVKIGKGKVISRCGHECNILYDPAVWGDLCPGYNPPWPPEPWK